MQPLADLAQHLLVDVFDGENDRRRGVAGGEIVLGADGNRRDDRRAAEEILDQSRGAAWGLRIVDGNDGHGAAGQGGKPPAQQIENGRKPAGHIDGAEIAGHARSRVFGLIRAVDD